MDHDGWRGTLVVRRFTDFRNNDENAATKLGNYYKPDGTRYDVNGSFTEDGLGATFTIADTSARIQAGTASGQPFGPYVFSWDPVHGGGTTTWSGTPYGVILRRGPIAATVGQTDRAGWIGTWDMEHDGWQGTLEITGFNDLPLFVFTITTVAASYTASDGSVLAVRGTLDQTAPHHLNLSIAFPGNNPNLRPLPPHLGARQLRWSHLLGRADLRSPRPQDLSGPSGRNRAPLFSPASQT
jgi:hypothetical protein